MSVSAQFLYREGNTLHLMKSDGYENMEIDVGLVDGGAAAAQLLSEGMVVTLQVGFARDAGPAAAAAAAAAAARRLLTVRGAGAGRGRGGTVRGQVFNEDQPVSMRMPETVQVTVVQTDPSFRGQQASAR